MQVTARRTTTGTAVGGSGAEPSWAREVGQNLMLLMLSVTATAGVTVLAHLTLNLVG